MYSITSWAIPYGRKFVISDNKGELIGEVIAKRVTGTKGNRSIWNLRFSPSWSASKEYRPNYADVYIYKRSKIELEEAVKDLVENSKR